MKGFLKSLVLSGSLLFSSLALGGFDDIPIRENLRCDLRYTTGPWIGYKNAYATVALFLMPEIYECCFPFVDANWHRDSQSNQAGNLGFGARYDIQEVLFGWNLFYDTRKSPNYHNNFNQIGVGLEALVTDWDIRLNTYFPIGTNKSKSYKKVKARKGYWSYYEFDMIGLDVEIGRHFFPFSWLNFYFSANPYIYSSKPTKAFAGSALHFKTQLISILSIDTMASWDRIFHSKFAAQFTLSIPFGNLLCESLDPCQRDSLRYNRLYDNVHRFEIIPLLKAKKLHKNKH